MSQLYKRACLEQPSSCQSGIQTIRRAPPDFLIWMWLSRGCLPVACASLCPWCSVNEGSRIGSSYGIPDFVQFVTFQFSVIIICADSGFMKNRGFEEQLSWFEVCCAQLAECAKIIQCRYLMLSCFYKIVDLNYFSVTDKLAQKDFRKVRNWW